MLEGRPQHDTEYFACLGYELAVRVHEGDLPREYVRPAIKAALRAWFRPASGVIPEQQVPRVLGRFEHYLSEIEARKIPAI